MKIRVPSYYKEFKCIASACEDTCCAGWDVVIDAQTYQCYQNIKGAFGEKVRSKVVVDQDGDNVFVLDGDRCPFLNCNNFCEIHIEHGEEYTPYTCKQYPRYMEEFMDLRELGISLSCPEAARIIFKHGEGTKYELSEDNQVCDKVNGDDEEVLESFFLCRVTIIDILEMTNMPLGVRTAIVLRFVQELQDKIDFNEMDAINQVREKYNNRIYTEELLGLLDTYKVSEVSKYNDVYKYFETYMGLEHINGEDLLGLNKVLKTYWKSEEGRALYISKHKVFNEHYKNQMVKFEKILVYYIYRYFMKSFFDYDMSSKIKVAIMSTIMIKELAVVRWIENGKFSEGDMVEISYKYSREIEHLEENVETLEKIFETEEVYGVDQLINTLINEF